MTPAVRQCVLMRRRNAVVLPADALIAAMSPAPDATREAHIRTLIAALQSGGVWDQLDCLYILAAHDAQAARLNWIARQYDMTAFNAPAFTVDRGYTGDGTSSYLGSSYNPTLGGTKLAQDSASVAAWIGTEQTSSTARDASAGGRTNINSRNSTTLAGSINTVSAISVTLPANTSIGFSAWSRESGVLTRFYKAGVQVGADNATVSTTMTSGTGTLLANTSGTAGWTTRRTQAGLFGRAITAAQHLALYNALQAYMTAVGA